MICLHCGGEYEDNGGRPLGFCKAACRHRFTARLEAEARVDWFAIKLRTFLINEAWSDAERQQRIRCDQRRETVEVAQIGVSDLEAAI